MNQISSVFRDNKRKLTTSREVTQQVVKQGVSGSDKLPDQGAKHELPKANETDWQSCHTVTTNLSKKPTQLRIYLPKRHAQRWLDIPPKDRKRLTTLVFGAYIEGVNLQELLTVESELKQVRLAINNVIQLVLENKETLDASLIASTLERIATLLGGTKND